MTRGITLMTRGITLDSAAASLATARKALAAELDAQFSESDWSSVLAFVDSAPARALHATEVHYYALSDADQVAWERAADERVSRLTPERTALARRLAEAQWDNTFEAEVARRLLSRVGSLEPDMLTALVANGSAAMFEETARTAITIPDNQTAFIASFLVGIGDAELAEIVAFYESETGSALIAAYYSAGASLSAEWYADKLIAAWKDSLANSASESRPLWSRDDSVYDVVEDPPQLIGGLQTLQRNVTYPVAARDAGIQGRVYVQFVVDETGRVIDPVITRSPSPLLSRPALDAVRASRFTPGSQDGRPVKVRFSLPINFVLTGEAPALGVPPGQNPPEVSPSESNTIYEAATVDVPPEPVGGLQALADRMVYPPDLRRRGVSGEVTIEFVVAPDGSVRYPVVVSSPDDGLSRAALATLRQTKFVPGEQDGRRVAVRMRLPFTYRMR